MVHLPFSVQCWAGLALIVVFGRCRWDAPDYSSPAPWRTLVWFTSPHLTSHRQPCHARPRTQTSPAQPCRFLTICVLCNCSTARSVAGSTCSSLLFPSFPFPLCPPVPVASCCRLLSAPHPSAATISLCLSDRFVFGAGTNMLRRLLLGPPSPFPSSDHKRRHHPQPPQLVVIPTPADGSSPDARAHQLASFDSIRSGSLDVPSSTSCHEAFACTALHSPCCCQEGGGARGPCPSTSL